MTIWQAILLGLVQGLTEFLPVSSSGHIELGKALLGVEPSEDLAFTVAVHGATVLSTILALWPEIWGLLKGGVRFQWNNETQYLAKIILSMIPVAVVGLLWHDAIESLFAGNLLLVGCMLLVTALLLCATAFARPGRATPKSASSGPSYASALVMGIGQAIAVLPGLSRSGTTISLGLLTGTSRDVAAKFSFLMVLPPIIGMNLLELLKGNFSGGTVGSSALLAGALAAFISGYAACRWMIRLVRRGKLAWFALYCAAAGVLTIILHTL